MCEFLQKTSKLGKKIGIYGGSFDPVHLGHINLAVEMLEKRGLDQILFCPTFINPHKEQKKQGASNDQRLKMLRLAIEDEPRFSILESELQRQGISYTIDTLEELIEQEAGKPLPSQFFLIIGEDAAQSFSSWHRAEDIVKLVPLLVGRRGEVANIKSLEGSFTIDEAIVQGMTSTRIMEISSTEVRERLAKRKVCFHLIPKKVFDYILTNSLYS